MKGRRIFWIFVLSIASSIGLLVALVQSQKFAQLAKDELRRHVSPVLGVEVDFERLQVDFFPPALSLANVQIKSLTTNNALGIIKDIPLKIDSLGITFRMLQAFGSGINVSKVFVNGAHLVLELPERTNAAQATEQDKLKLLEEITQSIKIKISKNFFVNILQFDFKDCSLDLREKNQKQFLSIGAISQLSLRPEKGALGILLNLEKIHLITSGDSYFLDAFRANVEIDRKGMLVQTLDAQRGEMVVNMQGKVKGPITIPEKIDTDLRILARARAEALEEFTSASQGLRGKLEAVAKVKGKFDDFQIDTKLLGTNIELSDWKFDQFGIDADIRHDRVSLKQASVRVGEGELQIGQAEIPYKFEKLDREIDLKFLNLDFHSFAGPLKRSVNNIEAKINGAAKVNLSLSKPIGKPLQPQEVRANVDLKLSDFALNNQTYNKQRARKDIIALKSANLVANLKYKDNKITFSDSQILVPSGKVDVSGEVSKEGVFDLYGKSSEIDWTKDLGFIAEIPFTGRGIVNLHVRGPDDNVFLDFDANLKDVKFVNLNFGNFSGKISLDDRNSLLQFSDIHALQGESKYDVAGTVYLDASDKVDINADFKNARPDDLFRIFEHQLVDMNWIPRGMTGALNGHAHVGGDFGNGGQNLNVTGHMVGERLVYWGEVVQNVEADFGFHQGNYFAKNITAQKYSSLATGFISYSKDKEIKFDLNVPKGKIRDLDYVSTKSYPIDSIWEIRSQGQGKLGQIESATKVVLSNTHLHTKAIGRIELGYETDRESSLYWGKLGNDEVDFELNIEDGPDKLQGKSYLKFSVLTDQLDFLLCGFNQALCKDPEAALQANIKFESRWSGNQWRNMNGEGVINKLLLRKSNYSISNERADHIQVKEGNFELEALNLLGEVSRLRLLAAGKVDGSNLNISLDGESSLRVLEFLTPLIEESQGRLKSNLSLLGSFAEAKFSGGLKILDGFLRLKGVDASVENLNGGIELNKNQAIFNNMKAGFGGGSLDLSGGAQLFLDRPPIFNIEINGRDNRLKFFPLNFAEFEEAKLNFTGDHPPYLFGGYAKVRKAMMRKNFDLGGGEKKLQNARYLPVNMGRGNNFYEVKIKAAAEGGVRVENDLLDAEFKGEVTLLNNFEYPQIIGRGELVKGRLLFRNTAFTLDHAQVKLLTPEEFKPQFSVGGATTVNNYKISLFSSGTPDDPKISFSSSPALSQGDILSLLAFGFTGEDTKGVKQDDMSAITYSEVGSILLEQLRISKDLQSRGFRVNVVPTVNDNEANIVRPRSANDSASPKIVVQTQVVKNLEASLGTTLGASQNQELGGELEYYLGRRTSVSGVFEQEQSVDSSIRTSYGADLKFKWGFK